MRRLPMKTGLKALPPSISIGPTSAGHAVSLCEAVGEVARERRWLVAVEGFSESETRLFVQLNQAAGVPQFVALCGLTVVGWCDIVRLYFHPGYEHNGRLGIGVVEAWRGQGLARAGSGLARPRPERSFRGWIPAGGTRGLRFKHRRVEP